MNRSAEVEFDAVGRVKSKLQQKSPVASDFVNNSLEAVLGIRYYSVSSIPHASQPEFGTQCDEQKFGTESHPRPGTGPACSGIEFKRTLHMSRCTLLIVALGLISFASGCCGGPCGGRGLTSYNYNPTYPTAYAPTYSTASNYGIPVQSGCSSCAAGVAPF